MPISAGKNLSWVYEGQVVLAPYKQEWLLVCKVEKACGHHAYVVCESRGFAAWREVQDLHEVIRTPDPPPKGKEPLPIPERKAA